MRPILTILFAAVVLAPASVLAQQAPKPPSKTDLLNADLYISITSQDSAALKAAVKAGADVNSRNWLGFTPLFYAASAPNGIENGKFLINHGARVNDDTTYGSALTMAAMTGQDRMGVFLLSKGANPDPPRFDKTTPLMAAAGTGCVETIRALLAKKVNVNQKNDDGATALIFAARRSHPEVVKVLLDAGAKVDIADSMKRTALHYAALDGYCPVAAMLIDRKASVKAVDKTGATPLHLAAHYSGDVNTIKHLLAAKSDKSKIDGQGKTPYDLASHRGYKSAADLLGSTSAALSAETPTVAKAIPTSLETIQKGMAVFAEKRPDCVSCHHQGLGLMTLAYAARRLFPVDGKLIGAYMAQLGKDGQAGAAVMHAAAVNPKLAKLVPAVDIGDFPYGAGYFFGAAHANGVPPNPGLAEPALVTGSLQKPDGSWRFGFERGIMQHSNVMTTAMAVQVLKAYWPADRKAELDTRLAKAKTFLMNSKPACAEDLAARVLGLKAAGADDNEIATAAKLLLAAQRPDGGWKSPVAAQSDAYTTGLSIYALRTAANEPSSSDAIRKAVSFLLRTQDEDGTWYVTKSTSAFNNHFDASFPHGYAQYASFAGTCWATIGLLETVESRTASR